MSWPLVALHDLSKPRQWKTIAASKLLKEGFPVYGANGKIGFYNEYTHEHPTLMITCRGATCGNVHISDPKSYINGNAMAIDELKTDQVDINYLYYFFKSRGFSDVISGSAQPQITGQGLTKVKIPVPPMAEQKRIALILAKAEAIRFKRHEAKLLEDDFMHSVFLDMFGDPVTNPKKWEVKSIKSGVKSIKSGWSAKGQSYPCKEGEKGVLKISAVTSGTFKPSENKFVDAEIIPEGKALLFPEKGDLLFSRANTRELVAATCIVTESRGDVFLPDKLWKISTLESELLPEFLHFMVQQPKFKERLTSQATGTSGSMLNISKAKFEESFAIFPPIEKQLEFKKLFWKLTKISSSFNTSEQHLNDLFNSLSQKAFSGGL